MARGRRTTVDAGPALLSQGVSALVDERIARGGVSARTKARQAQAKAAAKLEEELAISAGGPRPRRPRVARELPLSERTRAAIAKIPSKSARKAAYRGFQRGLIEQELQLARAGQPGLTKSARKRARSQFGASVREARAYAIGGKKRAREALYGPRRAEAAAKAVVRAEVQGIRQATAEIRDKIAKEKARRIADPVKREQKLAEIDLRIAARKDKAAEREAKAAQRAEAAAARALGVRAPRKPRSAEAATKARIARLEKLLGRY